METFSDFMYKLLHDKKQQGWYYELYSPDGQTLLAKADEFYDSKGTARYAVIGHIHLMEINSQYEHS